MWKENFERQGVMLLISYKDFYSQCENDYASHICKQNKEPLESYCFSPINILSEFETKIYSDGVVIPSFYHPSNIYTHISYFRDKSFVMVS